jgi:hypothetical protein
MQGARNGAPGRVIECAMNAPEKIPFDVQSLRDERGLRRARHPHVALRRAAGGASGRPGRRRAAAPRVCHARAPGGRQRHDRNAFSLLHTEHRAGVRRAQPARLRGVLAGEHRRGRRVRPVDERRRAGHEPVPLLQGDRPIRRSQPALAHHHRRRNDRGPAGGGADRHCRAKRLLRAVRAAQATRREVRHRARLRQPEVRRGPGARRRGCARAPSARVRRYRVEAENFESIHNHSAYASIASRDR